MRCASCPREALPRPRRFLPRGGAGAAAAGGAPGEAARAARARRQDPRAAASPSVAAHPGLLPGVPATRMGGSSFVINPGQGSWQLEMRSGVVMDGAAAEHVREGIPVLASYCDALGIRAFAEGKELASDLAETNFYRQRQHSPTSPSSTSSPRSTIPARHSRTGRRSMISPWRATRASCSPGPTTRAPCRSQCRRRPCTWRPCAACR